MGCRGLVSGKAGTASHSTPWLPAVQQAAILRDGPSGLLRMRSALYPLILRRPRSGSHEGSIELDGLVGAVEREGGHRDVETLAGFGLHLVAADHDAGRRRQRRAAGVFEAVARLQHRLLADHAGAAHFLHAAERVGDPPMAVAQLHRLGPLVLDAHVVGPDIVRVRGRGLVFEEEGLDGDGDRPGRLAVHLLRPPVGDVHSTPGCRHVQTGPALCRQALKKKAAPETGAAPVGSWLGDYWMMMTARRFFASGTPSGVGTAGSLSPRPAVVMFAA